jgi:hypothetical protein
VTSPTPNTLFVKEPPWWQRLLVEKRRFVSPLARSEVKRRVGEALDPMFSPFGSKPAQGYVKDDGAVVRRRIRYRNTFQTMARMKFHDQGHAQGTGTRIEADYGAAILVIALAAAWAMVVIAMATGFFVVQQRAQPPVDDTMMILPFILFPIVFVIGFTLTILFLKSAARADKAFLDEFITRTLDAKRT